MESSIQYAQLTSPNKASILWALARFETMARHGTMSPWQEQGGDGVHGFMKFYQLWNCFTGSGAVDFGAGLRPGAAAPRSLAVNPWPVLGLRGHGAA